MYSKNILLFFCVTLYVLQCQSVPPQALTDLIRTVIARHAGQDGRVEFDKIRTVLYEVATTLNMPFEMASYEDLKIKFTYSSDDAELCALVFIARDEPRINGLVSGIVARHVGPDDVIDFDELKNVCTIVGEQFNITKDFLSIDLFQRRALPLGRKFGRKEVELCALGFYASAKQGINETVKRAVRKHENPKGIGYDHLKKIIKEVKRKLSITKPFYSLDDFKTEFSVMKFDAGHVERIVITNLFPWFL
ncbi:uncharacterized protein LOC126840014 [Adelges cooleyi]|uniref:uncharacterized protein LOC126840014 n=1 Tax=Adelges cooleyi TaxID=133065 RepID=UPI00218094EC|nr:uncharacterized protein LOC126840014 [Adelges cooleyi]